MNVRKLALSALFLVLGCYASASASLSVSGVALTGSTSNPLLFYMSGLPASGSTVATASTTGVTESVTVARSSISANFTFRSSAGTYVYPAYAAFAGAGTIPYTYIARNAFPFVIDTYTLEYFQVAAVYTGVCSDGTPVSYTTYASSRPGTAVGLDTYKFTQNKLTATITGTI